MIKKKELKTYLLTLICDKCTQALEENSIIPGPPFVYYCENCKLKRVTDIYYPRTIQLPYGQARYLKDGEIK